LSSFSHYTLESPATIKFKRKDDGAARIEAGCRPYPKYGNYKFINFLFRMDILIEKFTTHNPLFFNISTDNNVFCPMITLYFFIRLPE